jgi:hypothetical protein
VFVVSGLLCFGAVAMLAGIRARPARLAAASA